MTTVSLSTMAATSSSSSRGRTTSMSGYENEDGSDVDSDNGGTEVTYDLDDVFGVDDAEDDVVTDCVSDNEEGDDDIRNIDIAKKTTNVNVMNAFPNGIIKWKGSRNARYVVLTDAPTAADFKVGKIDSRGTIEEKFREIIDSLPTNCQGELAVISCILGWTDDYRAPGVPRSTELLVSAQYVEELLLQMPNVEVVIALGQYAAELCFRRFDVHDMFAKHRKRGVFTMLDAPSPTMALRRTYDKFFTTVVCKQKALRYMHAPPMFNKHFEAFVRGCLYKVPDIQQFKVEHTNFDVRDEALGCDDSIANDCIDYRGFKEQIYARLREERREDVRSVFTDASRDPYMRSLHWNGNGAAVIVYDVEYNNVKNVMYMHGATPSGAPMRVTVSNLAFTFWFRPHVAFAVDGADKWMCRQLGSELTQEHLAPLEKHLQKKLYYTIRRCSEHAVRPDSRSRVSEVPVIRLHLDKEKDDNFDSQWKSGRQTSFIRCEVSNYAYIEVIRRQLKMLHTEYKKKVGTRGKVKDDAPLIEFYDDRMDVYDVFIAEKMFINRYNVRMSHWYRILDLKVEKPRPVSHKYGVGHCMYLEASVVLPTHINPLECLPPAASKPLGYTPPGCDKEMTSSDMPEDVRGSFDIEVSKFGKNFGTSLDSPIICICVVVRRHNNKTEDPFEKKTYIPKSGYEYFGFTLGSVQRQRDDSELRGRETLFTFTSEKEMLSSYYKFYELLKPRYYASHNGKAYDHPFCMNRAALIGCKRRSLGYLPDMTVRLTQKQFDSRAFGERTVTSYDGEKGISQLDTLEIFMREKKLESYRLGFLAKAYVDMTKNDMPYNAIMGHWRESDWSRRVLLDYCYRDSQLPDQILSQGQWVFNVNEMARANGSVAECVMHERGVTEKILGAYAQANTTIGNRYLVRTNDYKTKQENDAIVERWKATEDYDSQSIFDPFIKDKSTEGSRVVATVGVKRKENDVSSPTAQATTQTKVNLPRNKRASPTKKPRLAESKKKQQFAAQCRITAFFQKEAKASPEDQLETYVHIPGLNQSEQERRRQALADLAQAKIDNNGGSGNRKADYQGAVVMDACLGWHNKLPLGCMDFASLYPSIMMAYNMGSNTKVYEDELLLRGYTLDDVLEPAKTLRVVNPRTGVSCRLYFLKKEVCKGIMALMEEHLVALRNIAKNLIEPYGNEYLEDNVTPNPQYNPVMSAIMKQRSDGIKILANSGYGSLGSVGLLCDKDVAAAVTACGRESITLARDKTTELTGAVCRGGDTDSVFMEFGGLPEGSFELRWAAVCEKAERMEVESPDEPMEVCCPLVPDGWYKCRTVKQIERLVDELLMAYLNTFFIRPIKLEYEKAMCRFVAIAKKRYIYFLCIRGKIPFLNCKGIEVVRRDSLPILKATLKEVFRILQFLRDDKMIDDACNGRDEGELTEEQLEELLCAADEVDAEKIRIAKEKARVYLRAAGERLARGDVSVDEVILSKQRSREVYANQNQEHLTVVRKMEERGLDPAPVGSRVYYVYTHMCAGEGIRERKGYEIADDPEWVVQNNIPIDYLYYFEHKFKIPVVRIMRYFFYDDMVQRIVKRRRETQTLEQAYSRKRSKMESSSSSSSHSEEEEGYSITLDDITKETEDYLFGTAKKGSVNYKNLQTRYSSLKGTKVASAYIDRSNQKSIAFYGKNARTRREHLKIQYDTADDNVVLDKEIQRFEEASADYAGRQRDCRSCLKIKDTEDVQCAAYDCKKFYPRITAMGRRRQAELDLEELVKEFTAMSTISSSQCNDDK